MTVMQPDVITREPVRVASSLLALLQVASVVALVLGVIDATQAAAVGAALAALTVGGSQAVRARVSPVGASK